MANRVFGNGITVTLYEKTANGVDAFNKTQWIETATQVNNVLVSPVKSDEQVDVVNLFGKQAIYVLAIPKGDTHTWEDRKISFFGKTFHSFRATLQGIDDLIPGPYNKKVWVEINE
jgi:hypothetical protein